MLATYLNFYIRQKLMLSHLIQYNFESYLTLNKYIITKAREVYESPLWQCVMCNFNFFFKSNLYKSWRELSNEMTQTYFLGQVKIFCLYLLSDFPYSQHSQWFPVPYSHSHGSLSVCYLVCLYRNTVRALKIDK